MTIGIPRRDINFAACHFALTTAIIGHKSRLHLFQLRAQKAF
jgi:hypothetical protein